jgi:hypothetical protein
VLQPEEYIGLYDALLDRARRRPDSAAVTSALELAAKVPASWPALMSMLAKIPPPEVPIALPAKLVALGKTRVKLPGLFDQWEESGSARLKKAVAQARQGLA